MKKSEKIYLKLLFYSSILFIVFATIFLICEQYAMAVACYSFSTVLSTYRTTVIKRQYYDLKFKNVDTRLKDVENKLYKKNF